MIHRKMRDIVKRRNKTDTPCRLILLITIRPLDMILIFCMFCFLFRKVIVWQIYKLNPTVDKESLSGILR